jgi:hypothetical protein
MGAHGQERSVRAAVRNARNKTKAHKKDAGSLSSELLFHPDGRRECVLTLDANSATFTADLILLFEKNVARARRGHKKKFGSADRVGEKA